MSEENIEDKALITTQQRKEKRKEKRVETGARTTAGNINKAMTNNEDIPDIENRALWELFQNAIDATDEGKDCNIKITLNKDKEYLTFEHWGNPFKSDDFDNDFERLLQQSLSNKSKEQIGQFGTGFLTTHIFGTEVRVEGVFSENDEYFPFNITIDRTPPVKSDITKTEKHEIATKAIMDNIKDCQDKIDGILGKTGADSDPKYPTKFVYTLKTPRNKERAERAIKMLDSNMIPYVMTLNKELKKVTIIDEETSKTTTYTKDTTETDGKLKNHTITINDSTKEKPETKDIYFITNDTEKNNTPITIILPLKKENGKYKVFCFDDKTPRLFLSFPLIGTEKFGINFIIHSSEFQPKEPRNGIYLNSDSDRTKEEAETNKKILRKTQLFIFDFIKEFVNENINNIDEVYNFLPEKFIVVSDHEKIDEFFVEQKECWMNKFLDLKIIKTDEGVCTAKETKFLNSDLWNTDFVDKKENEEQSADIYKLIKKVYTDENKPIPTQDIAIGWTKMLDDWKESVEGKVEYLKRDNVLQKLAGTENEDNKELLKDLYEKNKELLIAFYESIKDKKIGDVSVFKKEYEIIPNINGGFKNKDYLKKLSDGDKKEDEDILPEKLLDISREIDEKISDKIIDSDFYFIIPTDAENPLYTRKDFSNDMHTEIENILKKNPSDANPSDANLEPDNETLINILKYCMMIKTKDESPTIRNLLKEVCVKYLGIEEDETKDNDDIELDQSDSQEEIIKFILERISKEPSGWVRDHIDLIEKIFEIGYKDKGFFAKYKKCFNKLYPNQWHELKEQEKLYIDDKIPEDIKNMYDEVIQEKNGNDSPIKDSIKKELLLEGFKEFILKVNDKEPPTKTIKILANEIEKIIYGENKELSYPKQGGKSYYVMEKLVQDIKKTIPDGKEKTWGYYFEKTETMQIGILVHCIAILNQRDENESNPTKNDPAEFVYDTLSEYLALKKGEAPQDTGNENNTGTTKSDEELKEEDKKKLGKCIEVIIEKQLKEKLPKIGNIKVEKIDSGQDFVIEKDGKIVFRIEVKSSWQKNSAGVRMTREQVKIASANPDSYALCSVILDGKFNTDKADSLTFEDIKEHIKIKCDIGEKVADFKDALAMDENGEEKLETKCRLDLACKEYRVLVPIQYIEKEPMKNFGAFINFLTDEVINKVDSPAPHSI